MFRDIPQAVEVTQGALRGLEAWRKAQGMERNRLLRQIPPETGKLLAILLAGAPAGDAVEIGTGAGYSGLWLALACRATGRRLHTYELDPAKAELARQSFVAADVLDVVDFVEGDGLAGLMNTDSPAFCFIDAERGLAQSAFELALPRLPQGGLICVDNAISHAAEFQDFLDDATIDPRVDAVIVPVGSGLLICRKT
ncbi:MAG: class I SAM-dependent methyltransferase [Proteobacteria bacterium]|nr:class I SAM-dependent methyltransferase [Pseudomonadota bacterium]